MDANQNLGYLAFFRASHKKLSQLCGSKEVALRFHSRDLKLTELIAHLKNFAHFPEESQVLRNQEGAALLFEVKSRFS